MDQFSNLLKNYLAQLGELLKFWVQTVAPLLGRLGVPEIYREVGALGVLYLLVTLAVALFILLLLRIGRRKKPVPPRRAEVTLEEEAEAEAVEAEAVEAAPTPPEKIAVEAPAAPPASLFERMRAGLAKTQSALVGRLDSLLSGRRVDDELLDDLEELLITADFGMATTGDVIQALRGRVARGEMSPAALRAALREELRERLKLEAGALDLEQARPFVIMVVGVNGVGKTTTIGKLASRFSADGKKVLLAAADTFRAAAAEQLTAWGERSGVDVIRHKEGADPSAVVFDACKAALARGVDILIVDTAGRLHTKVNLMEEMKKIRRVIDREIPGAPHETLLVLDAATGQNAISQARLFKEAAGVTGLALTKLDGTAKGGVVVAVSHEFALPVRYIGVGESTDDLRDFDPQEFTDALFQA